MSDKKRWSEETLNPSLGKSKKTLKKIDSDFVNSKEDLKDRKYLENIGFPGESPYARGLHATGYRGRLWTMRQYAGFGSAEESNKRFRYLISQGNRGLSVAFDLPTQMGYDSDHPIAQGEVGKVGVAIDSIKDMEKLFEELPLDDISTSMTINAPAAMLSSLYFLLANRRKTDLKSIRGTVQNDILKEYIARGTYIYPPDKSLKLAIDIFEYCSKNVPGWNTISVSGYHIREAGSTAVQELAFTLANGIVYVEAAIARGLSADSVAPRITFFFNAHNDFLVEIAKFRAARIMWADIMKNKFGVKKEESTRLRFHTQTGGSTLTAQQPYNNVIRTTIQALSAVLGGTQSLHTNSLDEALGLPSEKAARLALRTQQIIAHESGIVNTVDPLAGSWTIEKMTTDLCNEAEEIIGKINERGGMLKAIESGWVQQQIADASYEYQKKIEKDDLIVVGINKFTESNENDEEGFTKIEEEIGERQSDEVSKIKKTNRNLKEIMVEFEKAAKDGKENLIPHMMEAFDNDATLGEVCDLLRSVWGEYRPKEII
ncbi:MAG: methylmalonyl-CoA mutase [Dehalococcoidia bacterium]|nr:methylmalonyl-CoA mutase [Dehalococcoidia bacterium]